MADIWIVWVVQKLARRPPDVCDCCAGHRPGIGRFIGDQFAMQNAAPGFKSELKVTRRPPECPKITRAAARSPVGPPAENA